MLFIQEKRRAENALAEENRLDKKRLIYFLQTRRETPVF